MRRVIALCAATGVAISALAIVPAQAAHRHRAPLAGYYVIRWNNTGICQIWNTDLRYKPTEMFSNYKVVSKPVPTFAEANTIQLRMRDQRSCTL